MTEGDVRSIYFGSMLANSREGQVNLVDGTSCSSPIFASMISLVNDRLLAAGKPVLGFLNPFLYSPPGRVAFTDVISGTLLLTTCLYGLIYDR
jgi:subtilase family serine protease